MDVPDLLRDYMPQVQVLGSRTTWHILSSLLPRKRFRNVLSNRRAEGCSPSERASNPTSSPRTGHLVGRVLEGVPAAYLV